MPTARFDNPFHDLWVTEILKPNEYVRLFSPVLVKDAEALFSTGNIVLKGRQGSGKSMLLNLLDTRTRLAFEEVASKGKSRKEDSDYPVPVAKRCFIAASIQLTQQSAALIASRSGVLSPDNAAANFADYLNTLLCHELLKSIRLIDETKTSGKPVVEQIRVNLSGANQARLLEALRIAPAWHTVIENGVNSFEELINLLTVRLRAHRDYANSNIKELPEFIIKTRRELGTSVADLAQALRASAVIAHEALVFLQIDQHEELFELERHRGLGTILRRVINGALARRDPGISYRIGTRHYAWEAELTTYPSGAPIEDMRDFSVIDLDQVLRRSENNKNWKFPIFAKDVVARRMEFLEFPLEADYLKKMFGKSLDPVDKARLYMGEVRKVFDSDTSLDQSWRDFLNNLSAMGQPLDAKFGQAWLKQRAQKIKPEVPTTFEISGLPWRKSPWWAKERNELALMQIAGERQQALIWSGEKQVIELAGHNILAFMTICKSVWSNWQRRNPESAENFELLPTFAITDQVVGITEASQIWRKKIEVGLDGNSRLRFVTNLGSRFRTKLLADVAMSNPGQNGISLLESDFRRNLPVTQLLKNARDHGDLLESPHTTKEKNQQPRIKWYLHPLLCPYFRIPYQRIKEPMYLSLGELDAAVQTSQRSQSFGDNEPDKQLAFPGL